MSRAILASLAILCVGWWFSTYCVLIYWMAHGVAFVLREGAKGGFFN